MVIAVDGPAGVGKSSVSRIVAEKAGFHYLNSGNFYRAVTFGAIRRGLDRDDKERVEQYAAEMKLEYRDDRLYLDDEDISDELHSDTVDAEVAQVSAYRGVREFVNRWLRRVASDRDILVEGRDITTIVFPDASLKVFLDAAPEVRAQRRFNQGVSNLSVEEIAENIRKRDSIDRGKEWGRLIRAEDAFYVDTSGLTIEEVCAKVLHKIRQIQPRIEETES
jgi:cytidylate kinase